MPIVLRLRTIRERSKMRASVIMTSVKFSRETASPPIRVICEHCLKSEMQKEANELYLTAFNERRPLDEALIKEFQRLLTQNTYDTRRYQQGERPGEYKHHDYVTGRGRSWGRAGGCGGRNGRTAG